MNKSIVQVDMTGDVHSTDSSTTQSDTSSPGRHSKSSSSKTRVSTKTNRPTSKVIKAAGDVADVEAAMSHANATLSATTSNVDSDTQKARLVTVTDLGAYDYETLEEKIDSFIDEHPVAMFNRSWCLFSIDAIDFMVNHLNVTVHSLEVDTHPQGKEIQKYIAAKTGHKTTPAIFICGEFLGGFEQVNQLYASGVLQRDYLQELSQADKCEEFIHKANLTKKPLFWFPETVNAYAIRIAGVLTCLISFAAAILVYWFSWGAFLAYALAFDFLLRILGGSCLSPIGRLSCLLGACFGTKPRVGRPKQFASLCGFTFAFLGSIFYAIPLYGFNVAGSVVLGMLAMACGMEGFLDYCVGCTIFKYGVKLGVISK